MDDGLPPSCQRRDTFSSNTRAQEKRIFCLGAMKENTDERLLCTELWGRLLLLWTKKNHVWIHGILFFIVYSNFLLTVFRKDHYFFTTDLYTEEEKNNTIYLLKQIPPYLTPRRRPWSAWDHIPHQVVPERHKNGEDKIGFLRVVIFLCSQIYIISV